MTGKDKCRAMRAMRVKLAEANGINWDETPCTHTGKCAGTCPYCEAQTKKLSDMLDAMKTLGKRVAVAGVCAGMAVSLTACDTVDAIVDTLRGISGFGEVTGSMTGPNPTEEIYELEGDVAFEMTVVPEESVLQGKVAPTPEPEIVEMGEVEAPMEWEN